MRTARLPMRAVTIAAAAAVLTSVGIGPANAGTGPDDVRPSTLPTTTYSPPPQASALVLVVNWDAGNGLPAARDTTTATAAARQIESSADTWYTTASHARFTGWRVTPGPDTLTIPTPTLDGGTSCDDTFRNGLAAAARTAALARGIDPAGFDVLMYYFPRVTRCSWTGWGNPGTTPRSVWLNGDLGPTTPIHELGHTLGLGHGQALRCVDTLGNPTGLSPACTTVDYGDVYTVMGGNYNLAGLTAVQQAQLGWLGGRFQDVPPLGGDYLLQPIENDQPGLQALRIDDDGTILWLEFRQPVGIDAGRIDDTVAHSVLIHVQRPDGSNPWGSYVLDMTPGSARDFADAGLPTGSSWTDPLGFMKITVNTTSTTGAQVSVRTTKAVVPQVVGSGTTAASTAVRGAGLNPTVTFVTDSTCNNINTVMRQTPAAGTLVPRGTLVRLTVGQKPAPPHVCP